MPARASASRARSGSGPGASSRAARPAPWSRAPRHAEKRLLEIGAGHLEIAHDHAALEQAAQHRLGLVAQETHAVVGELEALHRQPAEGGLADRGLDAEVDALARDARLDLARRRIRDDDTVIDHDDAVRQ